MPMKRTNRLFGHEHVHHPVGARVAHHRNGVGHVEDPGDGYMCDVRWLTPSNVPSILTSAVWCDELTPVSDAVVPMPKSKEWRAESKEFCEAISAAVRETIIVDEEKTDETHT